MLERLYQPTAKDLLSGIQHSRFQSIATNSAASTGVTALSFTVPADRMRVIQCVTCQCQPGAAQFFEYVYFQVTPGSAPAPSWQMYFSPPTRTVAVPVAAAWSGEIWIYPNESVTLGAFFSAGGVANAVNASVFGWDIPRGNFN